MFETRKKHTEASNLILKWSNPNFPKDVVSFGTRRETRRPRALFGSRVCLVCTPSVDTQWCGSRAQELLLSHLKTRKLLHANYLARHVNYRYYTSHAYIDLFLIWWRLDIFSGMSCSIQCTDIQSYSFITYRGFFLLNDPGTSSPQKWAEKKYRPKRCRMFWNVRR